MFTGKRELKRVKERNDLDEHHFKTSRFRKSVLLNDLSFAFHIPVPLNYEIKIFICDKCKNVDFTLRILKDGVVGRP